jgi:hypothetical protein
MSSAEEGAPVQEEEAGQVSTDPQGTGQEEGTMEGHEEGTMEGANGELHGSEDAGDGKGVDENENGNDDAVDAGGNDSVAAEHEDAGGNDSVAAEAEATTAEVAYTHTHTHTHKRAHTSARARVCHAFLHVCIPKTRTNMHLRSPQKAGEGVGEAEPAGVQGRLDSSRGAESGREPEYGGRFLQKVRQGG